MSTIKEVFEAGRGILQLTPTWVPRGFNEPGHRLRLHPDDYYALAWLHQPCIKRSKNW